MQWRIGDVTVTKIVELEVTGGSRFILPQATREAIQPIAWLRPHFADEDGRLRMSIHSFVVETPTRRIVVDTCLGNDKQNRRIPDVERSARAVPGRPGGGGVSARVDRYRAVHPSARGPCRLEHHAGGRQMGADVSAGALPDGAGRIRTLVAAAGARGHGRGVRRFGAAGVSTPGWSIWWRPTRGSATRSTCADNRPYAGPCQRAHPLARRGGADHRRLHAPSVSDRASRVGIDRGFRSGDGAARRASGCSSNWRGRRCW